VHVSTQACQLTTSISVPAPAPAPPPTPENTVANSAAASLSARTLSPDTSRSMTKHVNCLHRARNPVSTVRGKPPLRLLIEMRCSAVQSKNQVFPNPSCMSVLSPARSILRVSTGNMEESNATAQRLHLFDHLWIPRRPPDHVCRKQRDAYF